VAGVVTQPGDRSSEPMVAGPATMSELSEDLLGFCRELRQHGLSFSVVDIHSFCAAAARFGPTNLFWIGAATLTRRFEDQSTYRDVFTEYFSKRPGHALRVSWNVGGSLPESDGDTESSSTHGTANCSTVLRGVMASSLERMGQYKLVELTDEQIEELCADIDAGNLCLPQRKRARYAPSKRGRVDIRRSCRQYPRTGDAYLALRYASRRQVDRDLVLILDVSRSMSAYSSTFAILANRLRGAGRRRHAFFFGTRITDVTPLLAHAKTRATLEAMAGAVTDWNGGTRIGESIGQLLDTPQWSRRIRGAVVVICSDGLDVGDPRVLSSRMHRLSLLASQVIWVNPYADQPGFAPRSRGMAAALPFVDHFVGSQSTDVFSQVMTALRERNNRDCVRKVKGRV
jgi:uncharacterized protein with von Willebrand factor type A (vWA) domain